MSWSPLMENVAIPAGGRGNKTEEWINACNHLEVKLTTEVQELRKNPSKQDEIVSRIIILHEQFSQTYALLGDMLIPAELSWNVIPDSGFTAPPNGARAVHSRTRASVNPIFAQLDLILTATRTPPRLCGSGTIQWRPLASADRVVATVAIKQITV